MVVRSELNAIKYALKVLTRVQTREDKRHIRDAHLNAEMREYLEEAIEIWNVLMSTIQRLFTHLEQLQLKSVMTTFLVTAKQRISND